MRAVVKRGERPRKFKGERLAFHDKIKREDPPVAAIIRTGATEMVDDAGTPVGAIQP